MKLLRVILVASATFVSLSGLRADDVSDVNYRGQQWLVRYYENQRPDDLLPAVYSLSSSGYFESAGQPATAIGFFSTVFAQNPQNVTRWLAETKGLPQAHRRILAAAAWQAGHPAGARLMRELGGEQNDDVRALLSSGPKPVVESPVRSASSMNLQWGAFLASGDERHIVNVLVALGSNAPGLATSARYTLAQNAAAHPRVLDICRAQLDRQPEAIRAEIRAALNASGATKPGA
jgi:hypothetical protein